VATSFPITTRSPSKSVLSAISSLTDVCETPYPDNIITGCRDDNDRSTDENLPSDNRGALKSVAEINCRGTFSLEKDDSSVLPKSWLKALHADEKANSSLVSTESAYVKKSLPVSNKSDASREPNPSEHGCGYGDFSTFPISPKLLCTIDCGGSKPNNVYTVASSSSVIDTATEEEHVITSKTGGFPTFGMTPVSKLDVDNMSLSSNDTMRSTSTSASQFIRDLVWLENRISMENTTNNNLDELERRASVTNTKYIKSTNFNSESEAVVRVACRDCYIPSGADVLDGIEIEMTDGPTVRRIEDGSVLQGHLIPGSRIVAVDDVDTKNASVDLIVSLLTSTAKPTHKVTVLQFESNDLVSK
jgi:hypothetical protein